MTTKGRLLKVTFLTTVGNSNFVTTSATGNAFIEVVGGGGKGGTPTMNASNAGAGGGGGGSYVGGWITLSPSSSYAYNIGNNGQDSYWHYPGFTTSIKATAGTDGRAGGNTGNGYPGKGGSGGVGSIGSSVKGMFKSGSDGHSGIQYCKTTTTEYAIGSSCNGGNGGNSKYGGGGKGSSNNEINALPGHNYGGGGGGGAYKVGAPGISSEGANGAQGLIIVWEYT